MKKLLQHLIEQYQNRAVTMAKAGIRPDRLPCETGGYCSQIFAEILRKNGLPAAMKDMMERCPHGKMAAMTALGRSFNMTLLPVAAFSSNRGLPGWSHPAAEPCFAGSPAEC